jgi:signal transduction histidine kinase
MRSIRQQLVLWLSGALLTSTVALVVTLYAVTLDEMNDVSDQQLTQVALAVLAQYQDEHAVHPASTRRAPTGELEGFAFVTAVWTLDGKRIFASAPEVDIPMSTAEGFHTVSRRDGAWRVYTDRSRHFVIQAAQPMAVRHALAAAIAVKILIPSMLALPLLGLLTTYALRRGLRQLRHASREIEQRSAQSLEPIDLAPLPQELQPLVGAINVLMDKLSAALAAQRQFTADAAHELRTPLTALKLQVQLLLRARDEERRLEATEDIRLGLARATHLVDQLLNLSRVEPDTAGDLHSVVDLAALMKAVVADFSVGADARGIDLGADSGDGEPASCLVTGDEEQLRVLLNNLVDNALRHTPPGGKVDVRCRAAAGTVAWEVVDSGPGIAPSERSRVFDRFYRVPNGVGIPGTGLGLAIVRAVAGRHGARIELGDGFATQAGPGLTVRVVFARAPATRAALHA